MKTRSAKAAVPQALPAILVALVACSLVPLITHLPWWTWVAALLFLTWRTGVARLALPARALRWFLVLLVTILVYGRFHTLLGERPGMSLLVLLMGLKSLEARSQRDSVMLVLLSYVALLGGLLVHPSLLTGLYALAFLVASFVTLSVISQPLGPPMRQRLRQTIILLLQAIPLALIAYIVFPRIAGGLWRSAPVPIGQTGLTAVLRPGSLSDLLTSRKVAMRVIFQGAPPPKDQRYFRAYVLTATNGRVWREGVPWRHMGYSEGRPKHRYTVLLNPTGNRVMPALDWPVVAPRHATLVAGGLVRARQTVRRIIRYTLQSAPDRRGSLSRAERRSDLALPPNLDPRIVALAQRFASRAASPETIVHRALAYFVHHHFVYTLTPPAMGRDPVRRFLFHVRAGYCEDYAAAFATLMRAAGVPTRVVVGFFGGEFNPDGGDVIVRDWDAHSWTEVWVGGVWQRVDPTAVVAPGALHEGVRALRRLLERRAAHFGPYRSWWAVLRHRVMLWHDAATTNWDNWVIDYNGRRQAALLRRLGWKDASLASLGLATLALLALIIALIKTLGGRTPAPWDPALRAYSRYCRHLARVGLARQDWEGPRDYLARAVRARPDLGPDMTAITKAYIEARYAQRPAALRRLRLGVRLFRPRTHPPRS